MKVQELMTRKVRVCRSTDMLNTAARVLWEADCGAVPIVDEKAHVVGMLTDRDICMAAYTQGRPLESIGVASAMSPVVVSCMPDQTMKDVHDLMRANQLRRLPVVDPSGRLVGIVSVNDLLREAERQRDRKFQELTLVEVATTLVLISEPRPADPAV